MNNDEEWVSEKLTELKSTLLPRFSEEAVKITKLQNIIVREKSNYCYEKQKVLEFGNQLDVLRKENMDLSDKLSVQKYVGDMMHEA